MAQPSRLPAKGLLSTRTLGFTTSGQTIVALPFHSWKPSVSHPCPCMYTVFYQSQRGGIYTLFIIHWLQAVCINIQWTHAHASIKQEASEWVSFPRQARGFGTFLRHFSRYQPAFWYLVCNWDVNQKKIVFATAFLDPPCVEEPAEAFPGYKDKRWQRLYL